MIYVIGKIKDFVMKGSKLNRFNQFSSVSFGSIRRNYYICFIGWKEF